MRTHSFLLYLYLYLYLFLFLCSPQTPTAFNFSRYRTLVSLSHSLLSRVAADRESRGDVAGAVRAREIADKLRLGRDAWALGWDFAWNYLLRGGGGLATAEIYRTGADLADVIGEMRSLGSAADKACWVIQNRERVRDLADSLLRSWLRVFPKSGPLREAILVLQKEVMEGELLKDCMKVGSRDLNSLISLAKDLFPSMDSGEGEL